jgi:acetyl-CoA acyltransferase
MLGADGRAIALGHATGCSGARILTTMVHDVRRRPDVRSGLVTMWIGDGPGIATVVEGVE